MAGKTKDMSKIKQLLLLKKDGVSNRKAAELLGMNKETANNYVNRAKADELGIDGLFSLQRSTDPVLFRTACETVLRHGRCSYRFIRSLVESKCTGAGQPQSSPLPPPEHGNIRGKEQFL